MLERHREVTRLEGFSDTVFAFALTLLVVSLEVPGTFGELMRSMREFVPFGLTFAMVCWIWYRHNAFFRRYGFQDAWIVFLNSILLFVVLFYVYPLKFLTRVLVGPAFGIEVDSGITNMRDASKLMMLYSSGIVVIEVTFALLHRHAWTRRRDLELTPAEEIALRHDLFGHVLIGLIGCTSIAMAAFRPAWTPWAGFIYFLIGPAQAWTGYRKGKDIGRHHAE